MQAGCRRRAQSRCLPAGVINTDTTQEVFSQATWEEISLDFAHYDFVEASILLERMVLGLEDNGVVNAVPPAACIGVKLRLLLDGNFGFDVRFAMLPPLKPNDPRCVDNEHIYKQCESYERRRQWGLSVCAKIVSNVSHPFGSCGMKSGRGRHDGRWAAFTSTVGQP